MTEKTLSQPAKSTRKATTAPQRFTEEERAAMKERAAELKGPDGEGAVLAKLAEMAAADRRLGERLHALITASAPVLTPKLWYGMPAYARGGKVVCFFQSGQKFKTRYATLGFSDQAQLDDGALWPTTFALTEWTAEVEAQVAAVVKRAVGQGT